MPCGDLNGKKIENKKGDVSTGVTLLYSRNQHHVIKNHIPIKMWKGKRNAVLSHSQWFPVHPNTAFNIVFSKKLPHLFLTIEINQIPISHSIKYIAMEYEANEDEGSVSVLFITSWHDPCTRQGWQFNLLEGAAFWAGTKKTRILDSTSQTGLYENTP